MAAVAGLWVTRAIASGNRQMRLDDATQWFTLAEQRVAAGQSDLAVQAFRRATAIDRDNLPYHLALARALTADGQDDAAYQVLIALRQLTPDNPDINVPLARLEAHRHDVTAAIQYYQSALHGLWPSERAEERRRLRVELIQYLLQNDRGGRALSELLILSANLPDEVVSQREIGQLFLTAGDPRRALDHFTRALRLAPNDAATVAGAGEAAFAAGDYARVLMYLREPGLSRRLSDMRVMADAVVTRDPLAPRLKPDERRRRLLAGLDDAAGRLDECSADLGTLRPEVAAFARSASPRAVRDDPDLVDRGVGLIGRAQRTMARLCDRGTTSGRAWRLIAARHDSDRS